MATTRTRRRKRKSGPVVRVLQGVLAVVVALGGAFVVLVGVMLLVSDGSSGVLPSVFVFVFAIVWLLWAARLAYRAATGRRAPSGSTGPTGVFFGGGGFFGGGDGCGGGEGDGGGGGFGGGGDGGGGSC